MPVQITEVGGSERVTADIETFLVKQAIHEQLCNYCRAMDRLDVDLFKSVWHEDGTLSFDRGPISGEGRRSR